MSTRRAHLTLHLGLDRSDTTTETEAELAEQAEPAEPAELATLMPPILSFKYLSSLVFFVNFRERLPVPVTLMAKPSF